MSTNTDALDQARDLIAEHINNNLVKFMNLNNGAIAHHCLCKDLDIVEPVLIELAKDIYNEIARQYTESKTKKNVPDKDGNLTADYQNMTEPEKIEYVKWLEAKCIIFKNISLELESKHKDYVKLTQLQIDALIKERDGLMLMLDNSINIGNKLISRLEKAESKPFFSAIRNLFKAKE